MRVFGTRGGAHAGYRRERDHVAVVVPDEETADVIGIDPINCIGLKEHAHGAPGIFLATAHPAKFIEIVGPIIGLTMDQRQQITPEPLAHALAQPRRLMPLVGALDAVKAVIHG